MIGRFEYHRPGSLAEALALLDRHGSGMKVLAGGTNLLVEMRERKVQPAAVLDIKRLPELGELELGGDGGARLGAGAVVREVLEWCSRLGEWRNLQEAARQLGSPLIRNRATVGGNLCDGSPAADTALALLTYDAELAIQGPGGERRVALRQFFQGPHRVDLAPNEILKQIRIPRLPPGSGEAYIKLGVRKALQIAIVGVAVVVRRDGAGGGRISEAAIALSSVAPTPMRAQRAEGLLAGQRWSPELAARAAAAAADEAAPISDIRASAAYRRAMVKVLTRRALALAWNEATAGHG